MKTIRVWMHPRVELPDWQAPDRETTKDSSA